MFKVVWFTRFAPGLTNAEARRYWTEHHATLSEPTSMKRYVQSHTIGPVPSNRAQPPTFDGYSCGWWDDRADYEETVASDAWRAVEADGANVFDMAWLSGMSAELREHTVIDGPVGPYKVVWVCRFRADMDRDEADRHWQDVHGPIFRRAGVDRYVQNHVVAPIYEGDPPGFDGFSECWFSDEAGFLRAMATDAWAEAEADANAFLDVGALSGAALEERVIRDRLAR